MENIEKTNLIFNVQKTTIIPKNFRTSMDDYHSKELDQLKNGEVKIINSNGDIEIVNKIPPRDGLNNLNISGSGQFSTTGLDYIFDEIKNKAGNDNIVIVDLREECHCFLNLIPVSWYVDKDNMNLGKNWKEVEETEGDHIEWLKKQYQVNIIFKKKQDENQKQNQEIKVFDVNSERYVVKTLKNAGYIRLAITDHLKPEDDDGDHIRLFYDSQTPKTWNHFHCAAGRGRTTTLMVIYDMMKNWNNPNLTFEDFIIRQFLLGGKNLLEPMEDSWKKEAHLERIKFLRNYYQYIKDMADSDRIFFKTWLKLQNSN